MVDAWKEQQSRALGPGAAGMINSSLNRINTAAGLPTQDYSALVTQGPRLTDQVSQEVDRVLANISPSAAARAGAPQPNYATVNPASVLGRDQFQFPGGPAAAAAGPGPAAALPQANSPFGAIGNNPMLAAIQARNRQLASQQTAAASANPANSPFGAIGANPMQGAMNMPPPPAAPMPVPMPYTAPSVYRPSPQAAPMPYAYPTPMGGGTVPPAGVEVPTMPMGGTVPPAGVEVSTTPMGGTVPPAGVEVPTTPAALRQQVQVGPGWPGFNPFGLWNQVGPNPQTQQDLQRILGTGNYQWP
jgi:hypothetical protein